MSKTGLAPHAARLLAAGVLLILFGATRLPQLSTRERRELAARFAFSSETLPEIAADADRTVRPVHPSLERLSAWISSVGASVALTDLDGDGLSNDVCYVDVRSDQVIIAPVPGTPERYAPFVLDPAPVVYDQDSMAPMGCLPGDMNEDGRIDILVYYWGRTPIAFLHRGAESGGDDALHGDRYVALDIVPGNARWFTNAATFADLDGDGHPDLIIGNYFQDDDRILDVAAGGSSSMQHSMSRALNGGRNRLLLWTEAASGVQPSVQFSEAVGVLDEEVARGWTLALGAADLDGDLLPEIYFANDFGPDRLLHNRSQPGKLDFVRLTGSRGLATPGSKVLGYDSFKGMGTDFGDLNGDGLLDIYVSNIAAEYSLEESHFIFLSTGEPERMAAGEAPYIERSEALGLARSGWGWDSRLDDFDNDGVLEAVQATGFVKGSVNRWPELHELAMGNDELLRHPRVWPLFRPGADLSGSQHNPFFVRAADGRYYDLAPDLGLDSPQVSRGIATADVDGDGDLDFAVANQWEPSRFFRNECPNCGAFLGLHLRLALDDSGDGTLVSAGHRAGDLPGRPAIGATASVQLADDQRLVAQVDGGNGHSGARSPDLHFGLGTMAPDAELTVDLRWRDVDGVVRAQTLTLTPGWHTVWLR